MCDRQISEIDRWKLKRGVACDTQNERRDVEEGMAIDVHGRAFLATNVCECA